MNEDTRGLGFTPVSGGWLTEWIGHCDDILKDPPEKYDGWSWLLIEQATGAIQELRDALAELEWHRTEATNQELTNCDSSTRERDSHSGEG